MLYFQQKHYSRLVLSAPQNSFKRIAMVLKDEAAREREKGDLKGLELAHNQRSGVNHIK